MKFAATLITQLRDHLLKFYPPDHLVHFVWTGSGTGPLAVEPRIETLPIAELDHPGSDVMSTLLIPRIKSTIKKKTNQIDFVGRQDRQPAGLA